MKTETYFEPAEVDLKTLQRHALGAVGVVSLAILILYWDTVASMVSVWRRSETYAHCFVVPAIVVWLVWRQRIDLRNAELRPWFTPVAGATLAGLIWLAASLAGVLVVSQFAVLLMLELGLIATVGLPITKRLLFPLGFAFFAVPAGEIFVPTMIDWTANFTIEALRLSGVPVYREGNSFIIPSGRWSVVEACSGIRYLIASFMGGTVFAYLTYRSTVRRLVFAAASLAVPIVANWLRAYMIVVLGHLTNNKVAAGVDHLIYGWILFGVVMMLLFWVGSYWREPESAHEVTQARTPDRQSPAPSRLVRLWTVAALSIGVAALWPALESASQRAMPDAEPRLLPIAGEGGWKDSHLHVSDWKPSYSGARVTLEQTFEAGDRPVGVIVAYYRGQAQGHELITSTNTLVATAQQRWVHTASGRGALSWKGLPIDVDTAELTDGTARLSVVYWYWINGRITTSSAVAKLWLAYAKLTRQRDDSALVLLYTRQPEPGGDADALLENFAVEMSPAISRVLEQTRGDRR